MSRTRPGGPNTCLFPKTTNQDFHGPEAHAIAQTIGIRMDKRNYKRMNPYAAFVNANFKGGVFTNPWQEQEQR